MKKTVRILGLSGGVLALTLALSGCFAIPLADGRSPFDDPFGPSTKSVDESLPAIEDALAPVFTDPYLLEVVRGSDNCEGPCKLSPEVRFNLPEEDRSYGNENPIPAEMIAEVMVAAIPAVNEQPLRISAYPGAGTLDLVEEIIADVPKQVGGFYYRESSDELFIPADELNIAKEAAERYLEDNPA